MSFYQLKSDVWLDRYNECYKKIIVISPKPTDAALISISKLFNKTRLSPFQQPGFCCPQENCIHIIMNPQNKSEMLCVQDISSLFSYLILNGFTINTDITKIMQDSEVRIPNLICYITK